MRQISGVAAVLCVLLLGVLVSGCVAQPTPAAPLIPPKGTSPLTLKRVPSRVAIQEVPLPLKDQLLSNPLITQKQIAAAGTAVARLRTLRPGMTRAQLLRVFGEEGGISTANQRTYVYPLGPDVNGRYGWCIKVNAEFVSRPAYPYWRMRYVQSRHGVVMGFNKQNWHEGFVTSTEYRDDVIIKMSPPYLSLMTID